MAIAVCGLVMAGGVPALAASSSKTSQVVVRHNHLQSSQHTLAHSSSAKRSMKYGTVAAITAGSITISTLDASHPGSNSNETFAITAKTRFENGGIATTGSSITIGEKVMIETDSTVIPETARRVQVIATGSQGFQSEHLRSLKQIRMAQLKS